MDNIKKRYQPKLNPNEQQLGQVLDSGIFKLLSEPIRIEILKIVALNGPSDITEIARHFNQDRSVISRHLKLLHEGGLLIKLKASRSTIYKVDGLAFLQKMENIVSDVKSMLSYCCEDLYEELYKEGLTYQDYLNKEHH